MADIFNCLGKDRRDYSHDTVMNQLTQDTPIKDEGYTSEGCTSIPTCNLTVETHA